MESKFAGKIAEFPSAAAVAAREKSRPTLIRGARQVVTMNGSAGPRRRDSLRNIGLIEHGAILISGGLISHVGPARRIENLAEARAAIEINVGGRLVMPGFIDSHTHLISAAAECPAPESCAHYGSGPPGGGLLNPVSRIRPAPARALEFQTRRVVERFVRHGTTTIETKSGDGLDEATETRMLRVFAELNGKPARIVRTYLGTHAARSAFPSQSEYAAWVGEYLLPKILQRKLAHFIDINCSPKGFDISTSRDFLARAFELGFRTKVHAEQPHWPDAARLAVEMNAASVDGLEQATDDDMRLFESSSTIPTLLPVLSCASGRFPDGRKWINSGAAIAIASGYSQAASPSCSILGAISLACTQMKLTPAEAISATTVNASYAVDEERDTGSLQYGKAADLTVLNVSDYREIPYHFGVNLVAMTIRNGRIVYKEASVSCPEDE